MSGKDNSWKWQDKDNIGNEKDKLPLKREQSSRAGNVSNNSILFEL